MKASEKLRTAACAALLFALNAFVTLRLFHTDYTRQMGRTFAAARKTAPEPQPAVDGCLCPPV